MDHPILGHWLTAGSLGWEGKSWRLVPVGGAWLPRSLTHGVAEWGTMRVALLMVIMFNVDAPSVG
jgi:hypothetical protein